MDLVLKPECDFCGKGADLYGSGCKHLTLCTSCGRSKARSRELCFVCRAPITKLIREYNVRANSSTDKSFNIGRFVTGLPPFSKRKSAENKWSLHKDGLQGRQIPENLRDKYHRKPWILEDETGQHQFQGQLEGSQSSTSTYYLLMLHGHGKEFQAFPVGSWYNFSKIAQYKQLTLEEAEEKMNKRRHNATGYERWMMKAAANGAAAFGAEVKTVEATSAADAARPTKKAKKTEDENQSDKGEEDEEEEAARKNRLALNKKGMDDEEEDGGKGVDFDLDDDGIEKGDDWEHEEIFTDDDEAIGNADDQEDLAFENPVPPEIKQDDADDENEDDGGLSKSGKELKKLLGRASGEESDTDKESDDDDEDEDSPVLAPKRKEQPKDETTTTPSKPGSGSGPSRNATPPSKSKPKRKAGNDEAKTPPSGQAPSKKIKTETDTKQSVVKDELPQKQSTPPKLTVSGPPRTATPSTSPVTEEEIRAVLLSAAPVTTQDLVGRFKARLKNPEDKGAFADILRRISKIQKSNGSSYVVLR